MFASRMHPCIGTSLRRSARPSWCPSEVQNSAAQSCFCRAGVKINGAYHCDMLLTQKLLSDIREWVRVSAGQCSSTPCSWDNELLCRETPDLISPEQWPPNSPDLNPVDYKIWATMQQHIYQTKIRNVDEQIKLYNIVHRLQNLFLSLSVYRACLKQAQCIT